MALKVLIVDDEKLERVLIRNGFKWEENGFEVIGEASSGKEALEFVRHRVPDVVLTDINMPQMDGLVLAQKLTEQFPGCRIVIITGYREFEYAQRAVRLGVEDFLLKPINVNDLARITRRLRDAVEKENLQNREIEQLKQTVLADKDVVMESFFQRLVESRISQDEAVQRLMMYDCEALAKQCICLNIKFSQETGTEALHQQIHQVIEVIRSQARTHLVCFIHYMNNILLYFTETPLKEAEQFGSWLHKHIKEALGLHCTIGMSRLNRGFRGISKAYYESEKACSATVLLGRNHFIPYSAYEMIKAQDTQSCEIDWETFIFAVSHCNQDQAGRCIDQYIQSLRQSNIADVEYLRLNTMDILAKAGLTLNKYGLGLAGLIKEEQLYREIRDIYTLDDMLAYTKTITGQIINFHEGKQTKKENKVVREALQYVHAHLYDPDLSLRQVASNIYANESYLSRLFKKEMEISLITYITQKRIDESMRLLTTTDLMVYEVAEKIGFRDAHYFSICFKKYTGITVKEFKAGQSIRKTK